MKYQDNTINRLLFIISISAFVIFIAGCTSSPTRESNPDKFDLLKSGKVKKANILNFKNCLINGFEVKNRIAYNVKTKHHIHAEGHRVGSYGGDIFLLLSVDIFNSGKTQLLRVQNSSLTDLSQQINAFDSCLTKYQ